MNTIDDTITIEPNCWVVLRKVEFGNEQLATIWSSLPPSATFDVFASNPATAHLNRTTWPTLEAAEQAVLDAIAEAAPR